MNNFKLVHLHIFKNGGSTFDSILKRNFGDFFSEFHGPDANSSIFNSDILNYLKNFPLLKALSSHHFRFPIFSDLESGLELFPVAFLRHPIDRIYSVYSHELRAGDSSAEAQDFRSWMIRAFNERPYLVGDPQTNLFGDGGTYYEAPDISVYHRARAFLESMQFCGVVEEYNLSMITLEDILSSRAIPFDGTYQQQNSAPDRNMHLSDRLAFIKKQAGEVLYARMQINNAYDLDLYHCATEKLYKQVSAIRHFAKKKHAFEDRMRCFLQPGEKQ